MTFLDEAYNRVVEAANDWFEFCAGAGHALISLLFATVVYGTFLIWVIPYKIAKRHRRRKGGADNAVD